MGAADESPAMAVMDRPSSARCSASRVATTAISSHERLRLPIDGSAISATSCRRTAGSRSRAARRSAGAVNIGLNLWLIPRYGAIAAAWSTLGAYAMLLLLTWWSAERVHPFPYEYRRLGLMAGVGLVFWQWVMINRALASSRRAPTTLPP